MCRDEGTYILDVDASDVAVGAVLQQEQEGEERVIGYASRCFEKAEKNYCTTRKELAALVFGLKHFRQYLLGREFIIRTDHAALTYLETAQELFGQQARWLDLFSEFKYTLKHRPGVKHGNADGLSRIPCERDPSNGPCKQCHRHTARRHRYDKTDDDTDQNESEKLF